MIYSDHLRELVVRPTLKHLGVWSQSAEELLLMTAAHESRLGTYLHQLHGPAVGIYQMEPATWRDMTGRYLRDKPALSMRVRQTCAGEPSCEAMAGNLYYATAMARVRYYEVPEALPSAHDLHGLASYCKSHYNTPAGAATADDYFHAYQLWVRPAHTQ